MMLLQPLHHIITHITLDRDFLPTTRRLGHTTTCRELLSKLFRGLLQIETKVFKA